MWRARFGRGFGPVVRQTINETMCIGCRYRKVLETINSEVL
jgi:hypothetical protein